MPISFGSHNIKEIVYGSQQIKEVYQGDQLVWRKPPAWFFEDDFNRTSLGSNWNPASGAILTGGMLKKNNSNGSSDNWTAMTFPTDDLHVRTVLGEVTDPGQRSSIALGSPSQYVYVEFSRNGGVIGDFDGWSWVIRSSIPSLSLSSGSVVEVSRLGTTFRFIVDGVVRATAISSQAIGTSYRRVNLSVRRASDFFRTYYSPTFDEVKIGEYKG